MCLRPLIAYKAIELNPETMKRPYVFSPKKGYSDLAQYLPCGTCSECVAAKAREWSVKCIAESKYHTVNCAFTLTYSDENIHETGLSKRDIQLFMKRLRKRFGVGIRYFIVGEYGDNTCRPHYHGILFGMDFPDKYPWQKGKKGSMQYRSSTLESLWTLGHCTVGDFNDATASYICQYVNKKLDYEKNDFITEKLGLTPPFTLMSRKPALGTRFAEEYVKDITRDCAVRVSESLWTALPRSFKNTYKKKYGEEFTDSLTARMAKKNYQRFRKNLEQNIDNSSEMQYYIDKGVPREHLRKVLIRKKLEGASEDVIYERNERLDTVRTKKLKLKERSVD